MRRTMLLLFTLSHNGPVVYLPNGHYYQALHQAACLR